MINVDTTTQSLGKIFEDLRNGRWQIPPFQRDFVWNRQDIKDLFDSVSRNYPIGSILVWNPRSRQPFHPLKSVGGYELPYPEEKDFVYVLDGRQRLSSLFGVLNNPDTSGLLLDKEEHDSFFNLKFDLKENCFTYYSKKVPWIMPAYMLMSTTDFRRYTRKSLETDYTGDDVEKLFDNGDMMARRLLDYKINVITVEGASLQEAVDIFSRLNSKGTEISIDWMANALSYSADFQLSSLIDDLIDELEPLGFGDISRNTIFRCIQSAFDDKAYFDNDDIVALTSRADFKETVKIASKSILSAVRFLREKVYMIDSRLLPYTVQLPFVMRFFMLKVTPTDKELRWLKYWFWYTTYTGYFTYYSLSGQRQAWHHFLRWLKGEEESPVWQDSMDLAKIPSWPEKFTMQSARVKALVMFELLQVKKITGKMPENATFNFIKLIKESKSALKYAPENYLVSFEKLTDHDRTIFLELSSGVQYFEELLDINIDEYRKMMNALFIPDDIYFNRKYMLEKRRELIEKKEIIFINKIYSKFTHINL